MALFYFSKHPIRTISPLIPLRLATIYQRWHQSDSHRDTHAVTTLQQPQAGVTGQVVGIGGVALGLKTNKTARFIRLIEHQERGVAGHLQPLTAGGVHQLGRTMPATVTVVEPPLRTLPLAKVEVGL
ncbi:hypothetical protein ACW5XA_05320 [Aeromonas dhakensis]|uniref:hypothetical protein n=1 Tax=Aeromonas dhakensis TaxID=196024 RepID=UPI0012E002ED|nr:hypothetical protein [Aeromonas dhakensis]